VKFETAAEVLQFTDHVRQFGWGNHDGERWQNLSDALLETDLLDGDIEPEAAWTNEFLDGNAENIEGYADQIGR
jgi:NitT/TauT family transport system substrate-binding protein